MMSGLRSLGNINSVGGPITEDEFWKTMGALQRSLGHPRPGIVVSPPTLETGRDAAIKAAGVANWCWAREAELPRWRWRRRAEWRSRGIRAAADAEGLWRLFGMGR